MALLHEGEEDVRTGPDHLIVFIMVDDKVICLMIEFEHW